MRMFLPYCWLLVFGTLASSLSAQHTLSPTEFSRVPVLTMPAQDNAKLLAKELSARKDGRAQEFAVALPAKVRPATHGTWTQEGGRSVWRLRVRSAGAKTLNLGFSEYQLPAGAEFYLRTDEEAIGPFTAADNEAHNQLWTPVIGGDELLLELRVPPTQRKAVRLYLTFVNHDFIDVRRTTEKSGSCNLDVICGADDGWAIVDKYRDIIRSVAAYHRNGRSICTGFLVNNANNDGEPLFMTANHCGIGASEAPSVVTYWNFQSPTCRQPNSSASGGNGNGRLNVFNTGSTLLARYAPSDMTLLRLDDPVNPAANAFFAGWDASPDAPQDTIIAIHHPGVEEKRISFAFTDAFRAPYLGDSPVAGATHITIDDWDIGTTEGGSSGSPVYDRFGRVRGQLHGGFAACGNDELDSYGFWHVSWEGGGTPGSRLRDWLDPCGGGNTIIDGFDQADINRILSTANACGGGCTTADNALEFRLGSEFPDGTALSVSSSDPGLTTSLSQTVAGGGENVTLLVNGEGVPNGTYTVTVTAVAGGISDQLDFTLNLSSTTAAAPVLTSPNNGETDLNPVVEFNWVAVASANGYDFQLSANENFSSLIEARNDLAATTTTNGVILAGDETYYWRVRANNDCGPGPWTTSSFTTADVTCSGTSSTNTPVSISQNGEPTVTASINVAQSFAVSSLEVSLDISHTYVSDLSATLTSPAGTTIQLFARPNTCGADDLIATFSDAAATSHGTFTNTCAANGPAIAGSFQPATDLATFAGENAQGQWTLTLSDNANEDGGAIEDFTIVFCSGGAGRDLTVTASAASLEACLDDGAQLGLLLGADFPADPNLRVEAGGQELDNYTFDYNPADRTMSVAFSAFTLLGEGDYTMTLTIIANDGTQRETSVALRVVDAPGTPRLTAPANNTTVAPTNLTLNWTAGRNATDYLLQYSDARDFGVILGEQTVNGTTAIIDNLPDETQTYFWRVIAVGTCGETVSSTREFTVRSTGVFDFGGGRSLSVYPNPVQRMLTVETTGDWSADLEGQLIDAAGRRLGRYRLAGGGRDRWDLGDLPAGVYYLRLTSRGEQRTDRLVVID